MSKAQTFQEVILRLQQFWSEQGCMIAQPTGVEVGAGTLNKHTFLRVLGPEPWNVAYVEPSRRPTDGRYGENPNRFQHYYQFQVILKPAPRNPQELYLNSLRAIGLDPIENDIRFVEDDWEHPGLGAAGLGWEVWAQGMEVTQFTYFQQCGGLELDEVSCELTYGLERLAMCVLEVDNAYDLTWATLANGQKVTYADVHQQDEREWSHHHFHEVDIEMCQRHLNDYEKQAQSLLDAKLALPAYDYALKCSHLFNLLDARGAIKAIDRPTFIGRVRNLTKRCAELYLESRREQGFPMLKEVAQ
ncbi:MAG: glycine--tRNA ligase subunit alpha [Myxococcaceae bacterium]|nr:glycine--tRNA ligase subunit alpha [Myxococcaceae bacterium]MBH2006617.1 glycine--tRNA ligase subunit alpha [Myxococcaceae bacterium]